MKVREIVSEGGDLEVVRKLLEDPTLSHDEAKEAVEEQKVAKRVLPFRAAGKEASLPVRMGYNGGYLQVA